MAPSHFERLVSAAQARWKDWFGTPHRQSRVESAHAAEVDWLVHLGQLDVPSPIGRDSLFRLIADGRTHSILGIVDFSTYAVPMRGEDAFHKIRNILTDVAHYLATHVIPRSLANEVHVWAIGPTGSDQDPGWLRLKQEIHQDTWSVPKSLWLPSTIDADPTDFLDEGILAQPWGAPHAFGSPDENARSIDAFDLVGRFERRLSGRQQSWDRGMVEQLLATLSGKGAPADVAAALLAFVDLSETEMSDD